MAKKRKRKLKKKRVAVLIVMLLFVALCVIAMTAPLFNINYINITPCEHLTDEEILVSASIPKGENIFRTNLKKAKNKIAQIPYVDKVEVTRKFPDKVIIKIVESIISGYVPSGDKFMGIDKGGKVVEITNEPEEKIRLEGFKVIDAEPGKKIKFEKENDDILFVILEKFDSYDITSLISTANASNIINITFTTKEGLKVILGSEDEMDYKIKLFKNIREQGYITGIFDVSNPSMPTYRSVE